MKPNRQLNILGASGHGKVIHDIAVLSDWSIHQFYDDNPNLKEFIGYPVSPINTITTAFDHIFAIGNNRIRKLLASRYKVPYITLIHPNSNISPSVNINEGTVIMPGVSINADSQIGQHCIINTNASVDHDCILEDYVHISPNAALAGNVTVGEGTQIGIGACVIQGIKIGKWCTIGAGTVIIKDIPDYAVVVGNPGKIIKYNHELS